MTLSVALARWCQMYNYQYIMKWEKWKEKVMTQFDLLSQNLLPGTWETIKTTANHQIVVTAH